MTEVAPQQFDSVSPCEDCPFAGQVEDLSRSTATVVNESYPVPGSVRLCDVTIAFEQGVARSGEVIIRSEGHSNLASRAIDEVEERIGKCAANGEPARGRSSAFIAGMILRKQVVECGAFHDREESNGVVYPNKVINIINAGEAEK